MTEIHDRATTLLGAIWRGIPPDYKARYKFGIWQQFENQVRSAAYTTSLSLFLSRICSRLQVSLHEPDLPQVRAVVAGGGDRDVLRVLRDESAYCVTVVRINNDERKERVRR